MKIKLSRMLLLVLTAVSLGGCSHGSKPVKEDIFALDTYITFTVYGRLNADAAIKAAISRIRDIENRMSATKPGSEISLINEKAGIEPVKVKPDTFYVIKKALEYAELTGGVFDITTLPLKRLWNISGDNTRIPSQEEISEKLALVDYRKVRLDEAESTVYLEEKGMMIDLGGIAKGYCGDEAVRILKAHNIQHALINLGGDIVTLGTKPDGTPWKIGIQNPRIAEDEEGRQHVAVFDISGGTIVTSGDYERYMIRVYEETGIRYHHIFDPRTGYPADTGAISVTVKGASAVDCDTLATSIFILGAEEGLKLAESLENIDVMIITEDKKLRFSKGFGEQAYSIHPAYAKQSSGTGD
ncbi:MAG TPA: FAD:protein FMN transferase [Candidatus Atribacteria bacterium]|nr:FAD:protein FMN transferase [Candidatus Atribacteria bacterium]